MIGSPIRTGGAISLLDCDYKICARALAGRLLKVLHHVIYPDQTCGMKGRFIGAGVRSAVLVNGYTSKFFMPSRGVRQGCPLSPLLYIISVEVLAVNLRAHPNIVGLRLPNVPSCLPVLSLYADDTSVIASSDDAIRAVFCIYDKFQRGTGAKLNMEKCEGLWLGGWITVRTVLFLFSGDLKRSKYLVCSWGTGIWTNAIGGLV